VCPSRCLQAIMFVDVVVSFSLRIALQILAGLCCVCIVFAHGLQPFVDTVFFACYV